MAPTPRDSDGNVTPHDDPDEIPDESFVIRYIRRDQIVEAEDGTFRPSSASFSGSARERDKYCSMSVEIYDKIVADSVKIEDRFSENHAAAVKIRVRFLRDLGLRVGPDPLETNPYHGGVWGVKRRHRNKIVEGSEWIVKPKTT